jgi:hypothetical protein
MRSGLPALPDASWSRSSEWRAADHESAGVEAGYLRKFMNILVRAFTWLL